MKKIYNLKTGEVKEMEHTEEELQEMEKQNEKLQKQSEIQELKIKLEQTDYQAIKYCEGQLSKEEYEPMKIQRQEWRDRINELESEVQENDT